MGRLWTFKETWVFRDFGYFKETELFKDCRTFEVVTLCSMFNMMSWEQIRKSSLQFNSDMYVVNCVD